MKKPFIVEMPTGTMAESAAHWLTNYTRDLAWVQLNWRIWDEEACDNELTAQERLSKRYYGSNKNPIRRRTVDAIFFASRRDAMFFKLRFL